MKGGKWEVFFLLIYIMIYFGKKITVFFIKKQKILTLYKINSNITIQQYYNIT